MPKQGAVLCAFYQLLHDKLANTHLMYEKNDPCVLCTCFWVAFILHRSMLCSQTLADTLLWQHTNTSSSQVM